MRISIIVPTLNEAACIDATLGALASLRARGHEVIVVDGGSSDATVALSADKADRVITAPRGRATQMNSGADAASGDVLVFVHGDTRLPDDADLSIARELAQRGRAWGRFDVSIDSRHPLLGIVGSAMNLRSRLTGIATGDQAMFVRRTEFEAVGGFPSLALMEDVAISRLLKRRSPPLCLRDRVVTSARRWESKGVLRTIALMWWLRWRYFLGTSPERLAWSYEGLARETTVIVFAKAPIPGEAKTRLIPRLGAQGAARLHAALVERSLETAGAAGIGGVELCCAPDATHPFFAACAERFGVALTAQAAGDLGTRMLSAFDRVVPRTGPALLIGTDCPALTPEHLREAADAFAAGHDAVLGPAEDGGYVLVGLARTSPRLFEGIAWGGPDVMRITRARLAELGWRWHELPQLWDVDRPADLARLAERIEDGSRYMEAAMHAGA